MCVLLVEDEQLVRDVLYEHLCDHDLPVLVAEDGDAAAALIENAPRRLSVILTDFHMPGTRHGLDVADHARLWHPHVHVFIMTGRPDALPSHRLAPDYTVVRKPMPMFALMTRLISLVER